MTAFIFKIDGLRVLYAHSVVGATCAWSAARTARQLWPDLAAAQTARDLLQTGHALALSLEKIAPAAVYAETCRRAGETP